MSYNRSRSRIHIPDSTGRVWADFQCGGSDTYTGNTYVINGESDSMSDVVVDNFAARIARGEIINNPCVYKWTSRKSIDYPGEATYIFGGNCPYYTLSGPLTQHRASVYTTGGSLFDGLDPSNPEERAKLVALSHIDSSPYAFGEDIGEIGETLRFLRNPLESIYGLSKAFRKLVNNFVKNGMSFADALAKAWLQYRFAFTPLVRSLLDLVEAYNLKPQRRPERLSARGFSRSWDDNSKNITLWSGSSSGTFYTNESINIEGHAVILYRISNPAYGWRFHLGLRVKDLPYTFWQLMPYSFMVDRLLDISASTKALINLADPKVEILAGSYRSKTKSIKSMQLVNETSPGVTITTNGEIFVEESFTYDRNVWSPSVSDALPGFTPKHLVNSATKIADLVSLILVNIR